MIRSAIRIKVPRALRMLDQGLGGDFAAAFAGTGIEASTRARFRNRTGATRASLRGRTERRGRDWVHRLRVETIAGAVYEYGMPRAQVVGRRYRSGKQTAVQLAAIPRKLFLRRILRRRATRLRRALRARVAALGAS